MKKLLTGFTMVFIAMVTLMPLAKAQKAPFTGTVVFDVKAEGEIPEQAKAMMPTEMTLKLTPEKQSMSMNFGMMEQKTISDVATQESNSMMNVMGQKLVLKVTAAQVKEQRLAQGETSGVKLLADTKTIAGYVCKKAVITKKVKDGADITMEVFYTDDIDVSNFKFSNAIPELNGFPMEYSMKSGPMAFKMVARSVKKENIAASEFVVPADYKQVTQEELRNMFGGGGQ
jgi:GLPGLI family protein